MVWLGVHVHRRFPFFYGVEGDQLYVGMRNIDTNNPLANIRCPHGLTEAQRHFFNSYHHRLIIFIWQVPDKLHLLLWDYQHMPWLDGVDVQKRQCPVIFINLVRGNLALDNLRENRVLHKFIVPKLAEREGFEPSVPCGTLLFESSA